jgi:GntR family transcriptional regulator/MocR family aminotransferase
VARWARERRAFVVEDDYDAEYRYDRAPVGALQGLAPDRVIYAGTASKTLAPGLRLGWLVVPSAILAGVVEAKRLADRGSPVLDQLTFADFVDQGEFDRHLRRTRPVYRRRRDALLAAVRDRLPEFKPAGVAAGLHLMTYLPDWLDEPRLIEAARARGVALHGLSPYYLSGAGRSGLVFGYATLDESTISAGIDLVADAVAEIREAA